MFPLTPSQRDKIENWATVRGVGLALAVGSVGHVICAEAGDPGMSHLLALAAGWLLAIVGDRKARRVGRRH